MPKSTTGSLTIVNAHQPAPQVFWNGVVVPGITALRVDNGAAAQKVYLTVAEDPVLAEMAAAGITIKREVTV